VARWQLWTEGKEGERRSVLIKKEGIQSIEPQRVRKKCFICNFIFENYEQLKQSVVESEEIRNY
jgi:hypothetical protein